MLNIINYNFHLLLNSKYKTILYLLLYFLIWFCYVSFFNHSSYLVCDPNVTNEEYDLLIDKTVGLVYFFGIAFIFVALQHLNPIDTIDLCSQIDLLTYLHSDGTALPLNSVLVEDNSQIAILKQEINFAQQEIETLRTIISELQKTNHRLTIDSISAQRLADDFEVDLQQMIEVNQKLSVFLDGLYHRVPAVQAEIKTFMEQNPAPYAP